MAESRAEIYRVGTERKELQKLLKSAYYTTGKINIYIKKLHKSSIRGTLLKHRDEWSHEVYQVEAFIMQLRRKVEDVIQWTEQVTDEHFSEDPIIVSTSDDRSSESDSA